MTRVVLANPGQLATAGVDEWPGVEMTWEGPDGSWWDLSSGSGPVTLLAVRGLHLPVVDRFTSTAPGLAGSRFRGVRVRPREVWWAVDVHAPRGLPWVEQDAAWWRACSWEDEGVWSVTVGSQTRRLRLRLVGSEDSMPVDPTVTGDATVPIMWEAGQPYWEAAEITRRFVATSGTDRFFGASGDAGVLIISPGNTLGSAAISNPGDVPTWPVWELTGPFTSATVGVDGHDIELPGLASGESIRIDTRPDQQTAIDGAGVDRVSDLGSVEFGQVPAGGTTVPLTITAAGTGTGMTATVSITPLYRRAW